MSSLWTPGGEVPVDRETTRAASPQAPSQSASAGPPGGLDGGAGGIDPGELLAAIMAGLPEDQRAEFEQAFAELTDEERSDYLQAMAQRAEVQRQVVESPVEMQVANHAAGLFELAALHLQHPPPNLPEAKLAIDALAGLLAGVSGRLGEHEPDLKAMLTQIQLAFVQVSGGPGAGDGDSDG